VIAAATAVTVVTEQDTVQGDGEAHGSLMAAFIEPPGRFECRLQHALSEETVMSDLFGLMCRLRASASSLS
jgi:hypothetical protein